MVTLVQGCTSGNQGNKLSRSLPVLFTLLLCLSEVGEHHLCKAAVGSASLWSISHPELVQSCSVRTTPRAVRTCLCLQPPATSALCLIEPGSGLQVAAGPAVGPPWSRACLSLQGNWDIHLATHAWDIPQTV